MLTQANDNSESRAHAPFNGSIAVSVYDLMFYDGDDIKPAASMTDQGSEVLNQLYFAKRFAGLALDGRLVTDTAVSTRFPFAPIIVATIDCTSSTFVRGDLVSPKESAGGVALENAAVVKNANIYSAIGRVVEDYPSATTRVKVEFCSAYSRQLSAVQLQKGPLCLPPATVETMTGAGVLTVNSSRLQVLDPDGARDLTMPAEALSFGDSFVIKNVASGAEDITIKDDAPATVGVISQGETGVVYCDGTTWRMFVCASG